MRNFFKFVKIAIVLGLIVIGGVFSANNSEPISIAIPMLYEVEVASYAVFFALIGLGSLFTAGFFLVDSFQKFLLIRKMTRQLEELKPAVETAPKDSGADKPEQQLDLGADESRSLPAENTSAKPT